MGGLLKSNLSERKEARVFWIYGDFGRFPQIPDADIISGLNEKLQNHLVPYFFLHERLVVKWT
jgi:hypothetical protein